MLSELDQAPRQPPNLLGASLLAAHMLLLLPASATAAQVVANLVVTATVVATCVVSTTDLVFGTYTGARKDVNASVTVTCSSLTPYYVNLDEGLAFNAGFDGARMSGPGGAELRYDKFKDAARTVHWGNTHNLDGQSGTGSGSPQMYTIYGQLFEGQYVRPGAYIDTITATVQY